VSGVPGLKLQYLPTHHVLMVYSQQPDQEERAHYAGTIGRQSGSTGNEQQFNHKGDASDNGGNSGSGSNGCGGGH